MSENYMEQMAAVERANEPELGAVHPVGEESVAVITRLNAFDTDQAAVGNILRRTCQVVGDAACQAVCIRRGTPEYDANVDRLCADRNLAQGLEGLGIAPSDVLMVGVTADEVGFGDKLGEYIAAGRVKENPEGWRELPGFNAFFARPEEVPAIGSRLADCAHFEFEFKDSEDKTVIGFEHGTRPNMFGKDKYAFELDGKPVSYTEFVLASALKHYGADPACVRIRLSSSIRAENFVKHFDSREAMEKHIPGWLDAGFVWNVSNPDWKPGDPMRQEDTWHADARGMALHDIDQAMTSLGIPHAQFDCGDMLDPADTNGEFSSHENRDSFGDSRDLYMVAHRSAFKRAA